MKKISKLLIGTNNKGKYKEIAEILETSEGALKASYHIAVKKLQTYLTSD